MSSVATRLHAVEISSPVLRNSTNSRVSPQLGTSPASSVGEDFLHRHDGLLRSEAAGSPKLLAKDHASDQHRSSAISSGGGISTNVSTTPPPPETHAKGLAGTSPGGSEPPLDRVPGFVVPVVEGISDEDINQVEIFYRSQHTQIHVCRSLTNMYLSAAKTQQVMQDKISAPLPSDIAKDEWDFSRTGIPVLVLDTGEHRRDKKLRLVLAEKGTGFTLWQEEVNDRTRYRTPHTNFHTITISRDNTRLVGFSFDEGEAATEFADAFRKLTEAPDEDLLNAGKKKSKKKKEKKPKFKPPKKIDISQPCCFVHVTKLERPDLIGGMFPPPPNGADLSNFGIPRATSESSGISECSTNPSEY